MENVSVIVATYNDEAYIAECLQSVAAAGAAEIIVINDASTDATLAVVEQMQLPQMRVITLAQNSGPSIARNTALDAVTHRFCAVIDADDYIPPERLHVMSDILKQTNACVILDELIAFSSETRAERWRKLAHIRFDGSHKCLSVQDVIKHDLGTLKPMFNVEKLRATGVRYHDTIRRGEDFILLLDILNRGETIVATRDTHYMLRRAIQQRLTSNRPKLYAELLNNEVHYHLSRSWNAAQHAQFLRRHARNTLALCKNSLQALLSVKN